ncbi:unnamed protein product, partial [Schistosoma turkestanicum]
RKNVEPYCEEQDSLKCYHQKAYGVCAIGHYTGHLPPHEQYFKGAPNVGGTGSLMDKCPIIQ